MKSLGELEIMLVGGKRLRGALGPLCGVTALSAIDWQRCMDAAPRHDFLLVEGRPDIERGWAAELDRLLAACGEAGVPRLLWVTAAPLRPYWLDRCASFERVFTIDRGQLGALGNAGAPMPTTLWPATAFSIEAQRPRDINVTWLGNWNPDWPPSWRRRLEAILRGAHDHGLHKAAAGENRSALLRRTKVVVAADEQSGSVTLAPPLAFDAIACGAAVITPHEFSNIHDFGVGAAQGESRRDLLPSVSDETETAAELGQLLTDDLMREEIVEHLQRIVANNHTYRHRLATLASAAGYRLVPDAVGSAPG